MKISIQEVRKMENIVNSMCNCTACSTYRNVFKEGKNDDYIAYCFITNGKSMNITDEKQCICSNCPVFTKFKFIKNFYCTRGSEIQ